jgi:arsenite/tail-anchored protein-transporting ATPase
LQAAENFFNRFGFIGKQVGNALSDLKLGELLETPPPGLDEAIAISKVVEFVESEDYARFTRIVFDTAPTGHTLRMLALPDFVSSSLAKVAQVQSKLSGAESALAFLFGGADKTVGARLRVLQDRVDMVSNLFRYVLVTRDCDHRNNVLIASWILPCLCASIPSHAFPCGGVRGCMFSRRPSRSASESQFDLAGTRSSWTSSLPQFPPAWRSARAPACCALCKPMMCPQAQ